MIKEEKKETIMNLEINDLTKSEIEAGFISPDMIRLENEILRLEDRDREKLAGHYLRQLAMIPEEWE